MPELTALVEAVNQLNGKLDETQESLDKIDARLDNLPAEFLPRDEAKDKADRIKKMIAGVVVAGVMVASIVGLTLRLNHGTTCAVRSILITLSTPRQPLPPIDSPNYAIEVERRARTHDLLEDSLEKLNIIWGCAGE